MIVGSVSASGSAQGQDQHSGAAYLGSALVENLIGRAADIRFTAAQPDAPGFASTCDLLVVTAAVRAGAVPVEMLDFLERADLRRVLVVLGTVGPWPAEAATGERKIRPLLARSGGMCLAPTLHVADVRSRVVTTYCRYWAPALASLLKACPSPGVAS